MNPSRWPRNPSGELLARFCGGQVGLDNSSESSAEEAFPLDKSHSLHPPIPLTLIKPWGKSPLLLSPIDRNGITSLIMVEEQDPVSAVGKRPFEGVRGGAACHQSGF